MADRKISDLTALTAQASGDLLPIVDVSEAAAADKNKSITIQELFRGIPVNVGVGTTSPSEIFDCQPSSINGFSIGLDPADSTKLALRSYQGSTNNNVRSISYIGSDHRFQVGAVTGTTASEAARIDSSGNVGVGTTSPRAHVDFGSGSGHGVLNQTVGNYQAVFESPQGTGNIARNIAFAVGTNGIGAAINAVDTGGSDATGLIVATGTAGSITERLRIDSSGRVGIGTSSPGATLDVAGVTVISPDGTNTKKTFEFTSNAQFDGRLFIRSDTTAKVDIQANGNSFFNGGSVGIGTTSPAYPLDVVQQTSDDSFALQLRGYTTGADGTRTVGVRTVSANAGDWANLRFDASSFVFRHQGTTERARIDSSGRLLVGTSSAPTAGDGQYANLVVEGYVNGNTGAGYMAIARGQAATSPFNSTTEIGRLAFTDSTGASFAYISSRADGATGSSDYPGRLVFGTTADGASSPIERFVISSHGEQRMFSSNLSYTLVLNNGSSAGTSYVFLEGRYSATSNSGATGTRSLVITTNGNVYNTNNSYNAISDVKLKENVVDATSQWSDLKSLQVRNYNFKEETGHQTHTQIGLIAQEVEQISPGLVTELIDRDEDGNDLGTTTKSVNYSVLYMKAVKALQEAMERIETLEAKVSALEAN